MNKLEKQLQYNVEEILDEYCNGMDNDEDSYPPMTIEQCRKYVTEQIYDMKSNGKGSTAYGENICVELKFLGNDYIYSVIDKYAKESGILEG